MYKTFMLIQQNTVILQKVWPANFNGREAGPDRVPSGHQL
jgi:hypothetical protein